MPKKPLRCHHCGKDHDRTPGAGLHCSNQCQAAYEAAVKQAIAALRFEGFDQGDAPNVFIKDGIAVTVEQVINEGMDQALARHSTIASV